jgi:hypothetical protein
VETLTHFCPRGKPDAISIAQLEQSLKSESKARVFRSGLLVRHAIAAAAFDSFL